MLNNKTNGFQVLLPGSGQALKLAGESCDGRTVVQDCVQCMFGSWNVMLLVLVVLKPMRTRDPFRQGTRRKPPPSGCQRYNLLLKEHRRPIL